LGGFERLRFGWYLDQRVVQDRIGDREAVVSAGRLRDGADEGLVGRVQVAGNNRDQ
jgi:hypothetical protein